MEAEVALAPAVQGSAEERKDWRAATSEEAAAAAVAARARGVEVAAAGRTHSPRTRRADNGVH